MTSEIKTWKAGELREDMLVVPAHMLEGFALVPIELLARYVEDVEAHNYGFSGDKEMRALLDSAQQGEKSHG